MTSYGGGALVIDEPRRLVTMRGELVDLTPTTHLGEPPCVRAAQAALGQMNVSVSEDS